MSRCASTANVRNGYLLGGPGPRYDGLRQDFAKLGYVEGKNIIFEPRFARGQFDRTPALAAELVAVDVDVIVAVGAIAVEAAQKATAKIPSGPLADFALVQERTHSAT